MGAAFDAAAVPPLPFALVGVTEDEEQEVVSEFEELEDATDRDPRPE